jgi:hypothetical protein
MIVMERIEQPRSTQTWYECTNCSGHRLRTADRPGLSLGSGQPLTTRFRSETGDPAPVGTETARFRLGKPAR